MKTKDTTGSKLFIGIDVHKRSWKIHTATDLFDGSDLTVPPKAFALQKYVARHYKGYQVHCVYEAGCCGFTHHRLFESFGWYSIVVNPADICRPASHNSKKQIK